MGEKGRGKAGGLEIKAVLSGLSFNAGSGYSTSLGGFVAGRGYVTAPDKIAGYLMDSPLGYVGITKDPVKGYLSMAKSYGSGKKGYGIMPKELQYIPRINNLITDIFEKNDEFFKKKYRNKCPLCGSSSSAFGGYSMN